MKNPTIATVLNILPGLGYIYLGGKRAIFGAILIVATVISIASSFNPAIYSQEYLEAALNVYDYLALISIVLYMAAFMYGGYISAVSHNQSFAKSTT